jgi:hypothetical protein
VGGGQLMQQPLKGFVRKRVQEFGSIEEKRHLDGLQKLSYGFIWNAVRIFDRKQKQPCRTS